MAVLVQENQHVQHISFLSWKWCGIDAEYVTEFAKDKVWENNKEAFKCQFYISGKQAFRISRCFGKVDVIITDSPIRLGKVYADLNNKQKLGDACVEEADVYRENSIEILLRRVKPYNPNGRNQTEEESIAIDKTLKQMLTEQNVSFVEYDGNEIGYNEIFNYILERLVKT